MNDPTPHSAARATLAGAILAALLLAAVAVVMHHVDQSRGAFDQNEYHLPAIDDFAEQWPTPNLRDYPSATTPGYHLAMAAVVRLFEANTTQLRWIGCGLSVGLIFTLGFWLARRLGLGAALALALPLVGSVYVLSSAAWLLPDNAAWWLVLAIVLLAMRPAPGRGTFIAYGLLLALLVFVRQNHLWLMLPMAVAAWRRWDNGGRCPRARLVWVGVMSLPAVAVVGTFVLLWQGLAPPSFQSRVGGPGWAVPATILALLGVYGVFYLPWVLGRPGHADAPRWSRAQALGAVVGFAIGAAPVTTYSVELGRSSGIWNAARQLPYFMDRSLLLIALATWGGVVVVGLLRRIGPADRWVLGAALGGFTLAMSASALAWQRYYEPFLLIWLAVCAASMPRPPRWAWAGPLLLAAALAAVSIITLW